MPTALVFQSRLYLLLSGVLSLTAACDSFNSRTPERAEAKIVSEFPLLPASIGEVDGVTIYDGGYSSLAIAPDSSWWVLTDRGPNLEASAGAGTPAKRFPIPAFHPSAQRVQIVDGKLRVQEQLSFLSGTGQIATGLPPPSLDPNQVIEAALGLDFESLPNRADGIDSEAIAFGLGSLWIAEEYHPSIWRVNPSTGRQLARYTPTPSLSNDLPLPEWLLQRSPNLGFEGLACIGDKVYASLQSPITPPGGDLSTSITRILRLDPSTGAVESYAYAMEGSSRKISDLAVAPDGRLLVLEHGIISGRDWSAEIYAIELGKLSPITASILPPERYRDATSALTGGVALAPKSLYVDLIAAGWSPSWNKPEGLAALADGTLLLVNDNDFGLLSPNNDGVAISSDAQTVLVMIK